MDGEALTASVVDALWLALRVAGPPLAAMLVVGLAVSVLQALTQVQEPTLAFLPKLVAMAAVLLLSGPAAVGALRAYADALLSRMVASGGMP